VVVADMVADMVAAAVVDMVAADSAATDTEDMGMEDMGMEDTRTMGMAAGSRGHTGSFTSAIEAIRLNHSVLEVPRIRK